MTKLSSTGFRYTEIKHGRVAMLATVGYLIGQSGLCFPGDISSDGTKFSAVGGGFDALATIPSGGALHIFALTGFLELFVVPNVTGEGEFVVKMRVVIYSTCFSFVHRRGDTRIMGMQLVRH